MQNDLELQPATLDNDDSGRRFRDFIVSGRSLKEMLGIASGSAVTRLGWFDNPAAQSEALRELRLQRKTALVDRRVELYVCSCCGDIGCGSVTAIIEDHGGSIIWRDFMDQSQPDERGKLYDVAPIEFDRESYFRALARLK